MKHIELFLDTSSNKEITIALTIDGEKETHTEEIGKEKSQILLARVISLLEKKGLSLSDLTHITVPVGPGSFTGLRVGVAIANTLGTLLQIPINGKKPGELIEPVYH